VWDWRSGNIILSTIRHSSAVRCFDFNYSQPNLLVCGCNDGHITVWNTAEGIKIDDILPETELMALDNTFQTSLDEHHSGSILSIKLSLDKNLMATTSNDTTCKIWKVSSYMKDINEVKKSAQEMEATRNRMNGCIDVLDETLNDQLVINDTQTLKIGELHLYSGYHADLK
jgi:WD40 repeat protein